MAERKIDYDAPGGVTIRTDGKTGIDVFMYKADPGRYLNVHGRTVAPALAQAAGFDVETDTKKRRIRQQITDYQKRIEAEALLESGTRTVLAERNGFKLVSIGLGRHIIEDPDGERCSNQLTKEEALIAFDSMVPEGKLDQIELPTAGSDGEPGPVPIGRAGGNRAKVAGPQAPLGGSA